MVKQAKDLLLSLLVAFALAFLLRVLVFAVYKIPTSSMQPNLLSGDFVISYKLPYGFSFPFLTSKKILVFQQPERGEIFVFNLPGNQSVKYIKRVVGLPGDTVEIKNDVLIINGKQAQYQDLGPSKKKSYFVKKQENLLGMEQEVLFMKKDKPSNFGPVTVSKDHVFVLGDNRDSSDDSRYWGLVSMQHIESKVFGIWFSVDVKSKRDGVFDRIRWQRIFKGVGQ